MKPKQRIPKELRYAVADFHAEFPNNDACIEHIKEQRWPHGVTRCEECGQERKHYRVRGHTGYGVRPLRQSYLSAHWHRF